MDKNTVREIVESITPERCEELAVTLVDMYTALALDVCSRTREELGLRRGL
jgi:hypothetical protein